MQPHEAMTETVTIPRYLLERACSVLADHDCLATSAELQAILAQPQGQEGDTPRSDALAVELVTSPDIYEDAEKWEDLARDLEREVGRLRRAIEEHREVKSYTGPPHSPADAKLWSALDAPRLSESERWKEVAKRAEEMDEGRDGVS